MRQHRNFVAAMAACVVLVFAAPQAMAQSSVGTAPGGARVIAPTGSTASATSSQIQSQQAEIQALSAGIQALMAEIKAAQRDKPQKPADPKDAAAMAAYQSKLDAWSKRLDQLNKKLAALQKKLAMTEKKLKALQQSDLPNAQRKDAAALLRAHQNAVAASNAAAANLKPLRTEAAAAKRAVRQIKKRPIR